MRKKIFSANIGFRAGNGLPAGNTDAEDGKQQQPVAPLGGDAGPPSGDDLVGDDLDG